MLLLLGCTSPVDDTGRALDTSGATPPPIHAAPSLDADGVAAALEAALAVGLPSPVAPVVLWEEMLAAGDDTCPPPEAAAGSLMSEDPCTAASGYTYQGFGRASAEGVDGDGDGDLDRFRLGFRADGSITDPDGESFRFGAEARFDQLIEANGGGSYTGEVLGSLVYPPYDAEWLAAGVSSAVTFGGFEDADGRWGMHVDGGYTVGETSVAFVGFSVYEACPQGPAGTVGLRGADGLWYDLAFDASACDGCGEVTYDGDTPLGRACPTVSPAFDEAWGALVTLRATVSP